MKNKEVNIPKPILIIGKGPSGKSFLAKNISCAFLNPITLIGKGILNRGSLMFSSVQEDTDLIIIDDVPHKDLMEVASSCMWGIYVDRIGKIGYETNKPQMIITADIDEEDIDNRIKSGFRIIKTSIDNSDGCNPIFYKKEL